MKKIWLILFLVFSFISFKTSEAKSFGFISNGVICKIKANNQNTQINNALICVSDYVYTNDSIEKPEINIAGERTYYIRSFQVFNVLSPKDYFINVYRKRKKSKNKC